MGESATNASVFGSSLADRINAWALEHPEATEYCINEELEARELLVTIAAAIKLMVGDMPKGHRRELARKYRSDMLRAAAQAKAMDYVREQENAGAPLEFIGLKITVPEVTLQ